MPTTISMGGSGGGGSISIFRIENFTNSSPFNEIGTTLSELSFDFLYSGGTPTAQSINQGIGDIPLPNTTYTATGLNITSDTTFRLIATDGIAIRNANTSVSFTYPLFFGAVNSEIPIASEIFALNKKLGINETFEAGIVLDDQRVCIAVHKDTNPLIDVRQLVFDASVINNFTVYDNVMLNIASGFQMYKVYIWSWVQATMGNPLYLKFVF